MKTSMHGQNIKYKSCTAWLAQAFHPMANICNLSCIGSPVDGVSWRHSRAKQEKQTDTSSHCDPQYTLLLSTLRSDTCWNPVCLENAYNHLR